MQQSKYNASLAYKFGVSFNGNVARVKIKFGFDMWQALQKQFIKFSSDFPTKSMLLNRTLQYCVTGGNLSCEKRYYTIFGEIHSDDWRSLQYVMLRAKYSVANDKLFAMDCDLLAMADKYDFHTVQCNG